MCMYIVVSILIFHYPSKMGSHEVDLGSSLEPTPAAAQVPQLYTKSLKAFSLRLELGIRGLSLMENQMETTML